MSPRPAAQATHAPARITRGILLMLLAVFLFALMGALVKLLIAAYDSMQIVWARTVGHLAFMLLIFAPGRGLGILHTRRVGTQLTRSAIQIFSTFCFFTALAYVPLAEATAIGFLSPLVVALLAVPMLGERLTRARLAALVVGFAGVLLVIQPGAAAFQWASLLILASAACYALYQVLTRRVSAFDSPETSVVYSALIGSILTSIVVPLVWRTPAGALDLLAFAAVGLLGGLGHYCIARALVHAPANVVAPFQYFQLLGAVIFGYLLFDSLPTPYAWVGAAIIVTSGLVMGWSESRSRSVA